MSDTLITIIAIAAGAIILFVFPLMTTADRTDDAAQLTVESAITSFVNEVATTGKITQAKYNQLVETLTSTGNTYDVNMTLEVKDINLGKKASEASKNKNGENASYEVHDTQIMDELNKSGQYLCKEGDRIVVSAVNTSQTLSQQYKNFIYKVIGNDAATISAEHSALITTNGK